MLVSVLMALAVLLVASIILFWSHSHKTTYADYKIQLKLQYSCKDNPLPYQKCYCSCVDTCNSKDEFNTCAEQNHCGEIN